MKKGILITLLAIFTASLFGQNAEVLATFNGQEITTNDLLIELNFINQQQIQTILQSPDARKQTIETIIRRRLLLVAATEAKLDTLPGTKLLMNRQIEDAILQVMLNSIGSTATEPSAEAINKYYTENDSVFYAPNSVHLLRIVTADEEAAQIVQAAVKGGIEFESLMKKNPGFSEIPTGDIGFLPTQDLIPELKDNVASLKKGECSKPILLNKVYQIFKVVDHRAEGKLPLEDVQEQIKANLAQKEAELQIQAYQKQLWEKSKIDFNDQVIEELKIGN